MSAWCLTTKFHCGPEPKFGKISVQNNMIAPIVGTNLQCQMMIKNINNILPNGLNKIIVLLYERNKYRCRQTLNVSDDDGSLVDVSEAIRFTYV